MKIIINENYNGPVRCTAELTEVGVAIGGKSRYGYRSKLAYSYKKWLKEQEEQEDLREFVKLKHKLNYEMSKYGEVDQIDLLRYQQLVQRLYQ